MSAIQTAEDVVFLTLGAVLVIILVTNLQDFAAFRNFTDTNINLIRVMVIGGYGALALLYIGRRLNG